MKRFLAFLGTILAVTWGITASAQTTQDATLFGFDSSAYPAISVALDVFDSSGNFVTGLTPAQVTLLEDNVTLSPSSLQELQPGVQFSVALDPSLSFASRDSNAVTRLEKVVSVLRNWASVHLDSLGDDLSLFPTGSDSTVHLSSGSEFSNALLAYQPRLDSLVSNLDTLSLALDSVSGFGPSLGMKRVVLYIGPPGTAESVPVLQNLTQRALDLKVRVHVWIVDSPDFFSTSGATALKDLAIRTGGRFSLFSGSETLPDPEEYLAPLRRVYLLTYASAIRSAGMHSLSAQVAFNDMLLSTNRMDFDLNVQPPNPILVTPPEQIVRQGSDPRLTDFSAFTPITQGIDAIIEFPDGYPRPLVRTALYVDGLLVDENTSAPFDRFDWQLGAYTSSADHIVQVQAEDSLGLSGLSLGMKVTVTVVQPERGLLAFLARNSLWFVLGAVFVAGLALSVALVIGRRQGQRRSAGESRSSASRRKHRSTRDPLTEAVESRSLRSAREQLRVRSAQAKQSNAYLLRLKEDGQSITATPIPVVKPEITIGSDPIQAMRTIDDPSVSPLHARLKEENGRFILLDERSVAGTWVNYEMINAPRILQHGDIIHIGRICYRFMLRKPPERSAPRVLQVKK